MLYSIENDFLKVRINSFGAEMVSVIYDGKERMWQNDNGTWTGHAPILFPICGQIGVTIDGVNYPFKRHGIARINEFVLEEIKTDYIAFSLSYSDEFLKQYPYKFKLIVSYQLNENSIIEKAEIINLDDKDIYSSFGGHTSFKLEKDISNYEVVLEDDNTLYSKEIINNLYSGKTDFLTDNGIIDLSTNLLNDSNVITMAYPKSKKAILKDKDGSKVVEVIFNDFPHLLLWHPTGSKMICIEPWHNLLDSSDEIIEFKDKDSIIKIEKGTKKELTQVFRYY